MTDTICRRWTVPWLAMLVLALPWGQSTVEAQNDTATALLESAFQNEVQPLLVRFCAECHSGDEAEADIDLASFASLIEVRAQPEIWQKVREVLEAEQMPPAESAQPAYEERKQLNKWVRDWLKNEARSRSGDPGPVILRRLSNAEYNYTIHELTGIDSLNPTAEFPVDGAAGEGFTNSGSAQGMSPSLVTKYLDAAKGVAQHAVLLPDGIRFSSFDTRRDHSDELVAKIQEFYRRFADEGGGTSVDLQGIRLETNQGGLLPVARYLQATIEFRDDLLNGRKTVADVANERNLSANYLDQLWRALTDESSDADSYCLANVRATWQTATVNDVSAMTDAIDKLQHSLWRFNPVGQIGRAGGPTSWMEPVSPIVPGIALRLPFSVEEGKDVVFYLTANKLGDASTQDLVEWKRPRLEFVDGRPAILLRDIGNVALHVEAAIASETKRTADYLDAIKAIYESSESIEVIARTRGLNPRLLAAWANLLALGPNGCEVSGYLKEPISRVNGNDAINGWGSPETPSFLANRSGETVAFSTLTLAPRSVFVHPSPSLESVVVWRSPFDGRVNVKGIAADADETCGNGIQWTVQCQNARGLSVIGQGFVDNSNRQDIALDNEINVRAGDLISLVVNARDKSHVCDTTLVDITVSEIDGEKRIWNLTNDVVDHVQVGNPIADSYGNAGTWHFCARSSDSELSSRIPVGSTLSNWRNALIDSGPKDEPGRLADSVQHLLTAPTDASLQQPDHDLRQQLLAWNGPLQWMSGIEPVNSGIKSGYGLDPSLFGTTPDGTTIDSANLCLPTPQIIEIRLPWQLAAGAVFVTDGSLHAGTALVEPAVGGCAQLQALTTRPKALSIDWSAPFVSNVGASRDQLEWAMQQFRDLFPAALCYSRIVPVDEVVTLTLYYREDDQLKRLMLDDAQIAELDRLWDQLYFVSQEPISLTTVFDQISEFATQDRPDLVTAFAPMRKPIYDRAEAFRARLVLVEPVHVESVQQFATQAWRRPLSESETENLKNLYKELRDSELPHDEAIRLVLARVLTSPAFLYKLEQPGPGVEPEPVSELELANRLSYFLWSSPPDKELREIAESGELTKSRPGSGDSNLGSKAIPEHVVLLQQTHRMLRDPKTRRLAIQFACQWLHVRDFDQNNDKNEKLFPEFSALRDDMYEETVLFFEDMFRNDGSILDFIDANHTFVNEVLARHYGIDNVTGSRWEKVDGMQDRGRGGVLGMATILASQSGASRTSPILRGNWVSETLLGERLPRPPANVPVLPETLPDGLTARQLIELHSSQPECAKCHVRIDPYGFALEQFDAIGRLRAEETDTKAQLVDGTPINGIAGVINYLSKSRRDDVLRHFCRKLLGYSLGREVLLSDEPLLDEMQSRLKQNEYRFSVAVETIVTSPQFLKIRGRMFDESNLTIPPTGDQ